MNPTVFPLKRAEMAKERAGQPYQPSNGTEGMAFFEAWCFFCLRDKSMREGVPFDECDDDEKCELIGNSMAFRPGEPGYPKEWVIGADGQPCCTGYVAFGEPMPTMRDPLTIDMFGGAA